MAVQKLCRFVYLALFTMRVLAIRARSPSSCWNRLSPPKLSILRRRALVRSRQISRLSLAFPALHALRCAPPQSPQGGATGARLPICRHSLIHLCLAVPLRAVKKVQPVLGGFDKSKYLTERLWATAPDGVKVPISLVYRKDVVKLDGSDPMLLDA
jgi:hypothetical protein